MTRSNQEMKQTQGATLAGEEPKRLVLNDGSALAIDEQTGRWRHGADELTVADALSVAGDGNERYVKVRTRAEVEWLWMVAEWCEERAERLARDLERIAPAQ